MIPLLKNKAGKKRMIQWMESLLLGGNELLKSNPQYARTIP